MWNMSSRRFICFLLKSFSLFFSTFDLLFFSFFLDRPQNETKQTKKKKYLFFTQQKKSNKISHKQSQKHQKTSFSFFLRRKTKKWSPKFSPKLYMIFPHLIFSLLFSKSQTSQIDPNNHPRDIFLVNK